MFEKIRLLRDRFSYPLKEYDDEDFRQLLFRLSRKDTVTDLLRLFDKQLSTSYWRRSTSAFKYSASSNCFEILYHRNLRAGYWWRFIWSFCFCYKVCSFCYKVSRAITKRKEHFLRIFCHSLRTWLIPRERFIRTYNSINNFWGVRKLLYSFNIMERFSSTSFSWFTALQIVFFLGFNFQAPPASL